MEYKSGQQSEDVLAKFRVLQELLNSPESNKVLNDVKDKNLSVFIGTTKSGKSTLVNYAIGNKLIAVLNDNYEYIITKQGDDMDGPKIGGKSVSETTTPTMWKTKQSGLREFIVDMPGFGDNRGEAQDIANSFYVREILRNCKSVKCVLLADVHGLIHADISIFTNLIEKMHTIFPDPKVLNGGVALIISKGDDKITQERICKKLTNDILMQDELDIEGKEWVKYFVDNKKCIAFFKAPTSNGIVNDDEVDSGILDTIKSQLNQIPVEKLANIKPGIARKSKIFLLQSHALFCNMSHYNSMFKRLEDWIASECGRIQCLDSTKDALEMEGTLSNLRKTVSDLQYRLKTVVTLSDVLEFVKEISCRFGMDIKSVDQDNIPMKVKLLDFIETIVDANSSSIFIRELERTISVMMNEINQSSLVVSNKLKNITLEVMEQKQKELDEMYKRESKKSESEIKLLHSKNEEILRKQKDLEKIHEQESKKSGEVIKLLQYKNEEILRKQQEVEELRKQESNRSQAVLKMLQSKNDEILRNQKDLEKKHEQESMKSETEIKLLHSKNEEILRNQKELEEMRKKESKRSEEGRSLLQYKNDEIRRKQEELDEIRKKDENRGVLEFAGNAIGVGVTNVGRVADTVITTPFKVVGKAVNWLTDW